MQKIILLFFGGMTSIVFSQEYTKLNGRIVSETDEWDDIHVINKTLEIGTITDQEGYFSIRAAPGDTLIISSIQYVPYTHVVSSSDIQNDAFLIKLKEKVNTLDEVTVSQYSLSGRIEEDVSKIPTYTENLPFFSAAELMQMNLPEFNDAQSNVKNIALRDDFVPTTIDFLALAKLAGDLVKRKKYTAYGPPKTVVDYFDEQFIIEMLEIPETEYYNFVDFVNENNETKLVLQSTDELKILEFLIVQKEVFIEKYTIRK